ncbi:MAG: hypothetical protein HWD62_04405 [Cyclobacteriaceae bacterium]|nr:MAG: hypothetical protein HWD62_04405 [Cyclobacteriaceae bacterium]
MKWLILVHVLGATVWVGGHLILSLGFLPRALQSKDINIITGFEKVLSVLNTRIACANYYRPLDG